MEIKGTGFGHVPLLFWYFCTKDLAALCPKDSVGDKEAEWFEEQGNKSCKNDEKSEWRCMIDNDIDDCDHCDCERLQDDFTASRTEYHEHHEHHGRAYDDHRIGIAKRPS
jgi:hypothetical protein